ncbi:MAG TPA: hypothetical protein VNY05_29910 [Candidatus Acidoferrales bacterium]|nr:hypothetical protein [Candidatus Acidoferrales bacterium]
MISRSLFAALALASTALASPPLTTIQDVLYKADGTRFAGTLTISWTSFEAIDQSAITTQVTTVTVTDGNLRVQLVPTTTAVPPANYTVKYNSDGRIQFGETWAVPSSVTPLRIRDVRIASSQTGAVSADTVAATVQESDVAGLVSDLGARPLKGPGYAAGRVAVVNPAGSLETVTGSPSDCVRVDGSSGPCGDAGGLPSFVDGDSLSGIMDGSNTTFTLSAFPNPASSLAVYRNGVLQSSVRDYNVTGNAVQFVAAAAPQPGDTLLASFRLTGADGASAPPGLVSPQQINPAGLTAGQTWVWDGNSYVPGAAGGAGGAGTIGATGPAGTAGATGVAGPLGPAGATGPAGAAGPAGATGVSGVAGATGPVGVPGTAGAVGPTGVAGPAGATGAAGAAGIAGPAGATGAAGIAGPTGPSGAAGPTLTVFGRLGTVVAVSGDYSAAQVANAADKTAANSYTAGAKQGFQSSATTAGINFGGVSADPSVLSEGDVWYRTDTHALRQYQNAVAVTVGGAAGGCPSTPFSTLITGATTSNGSLGCGLTYASTVHTDFTAAATTQRVKIGTAASLFSAAGIRLEETTTLVSGIGTITAMQACVGSATAVCLFTPGGLALFGSTGQFLTFPGPFSAAATDLATQDIYLTLSVTNVTPGNLSTMTGVVGKVTVRIWGGVAQ